MLFASPVCHDAPPPAPRIQSQAFVAWQWYNYAEREASALGRTILRVNLDETSLCLFPGRTRGNVFVSKKRSLVEGRQTVAKWKKRCCLTHVAVICDQPTAQPRMPQFIVGNEHTFRQRDMPALRRSCPPNVTLVRQKSAWNNASLMVRIVAALGAATRTLRLQGTRVVVVLTMDALRVHFHPSVLRACARADVWPLFVPAKMTWLLQPLDTHVFSVYKSYLQRQYQRARVECADPTGDVDVAGFLECVHATIRHVLQGRPWATAFDRDGYGCRQAALGSRVTQRLELTTPVEAGDARPDAERVGLCFPRRARVAHGSLWAPYENSSQPRASRLLLPARGRGAASAGVAAGHLCRSVHHRTAASGVVIGAAGEPPRARRPSLAAAAAEGPAYGRTRSETRLMKAAGSLS